MKLTRNNRRAVYGSNQLRDKFCTKQTLSEFRTKYPILEA